MRSPGGTKPMRRRWPYIPTPDAAAVDEDFGKQVHLDNITERSRIEAGFENAAKEQRRIEARCRDAKRRVRNVQLHGCARGVPVTRRKAAEPVMTKRKTTDTPCTADGKAQHARMNVVPCVSECEASGARVEKELAWEGC